jgi:broad specificity phosphatase PhoE
MNLTYFVHSTSTDNEAGIRSGWNDISLSETGKVQARSLRNLCANRVFDTVFSSDLRRAIETAELAFPNYAVSTDPRLREMNYGTLTGCADNQFPDDELQCIHVRYPRGENCLDVEERLREFLRDYIGEYRGKRVAIISHKYPQLALEVIGNGLTWQEAIHRDWRKGGQWQAGWTYGVEGHSP